MSVALERRLLVLVALLVLATGALLPARAGAAAYWVDLSAGRGEIQEGVNGFSWFTYGGEFNHYASTCEARPSQAFVGGAYCTLRFTVPGGLRVVDQGAGGGIADGVYRVAHTAFDLRTERPQGTPAYTTDAHAQTTVQGPFGHGWGALGPLVQTGLVVKAGGATTGPTMNNWFRTERFRVLLDDPTAPEFRGWSVADAAPNGWRGPGCHAAAYTFVDSGSQMWATSVTNLSTGAAVHSWAATPSMTVVASGVPVAALGMCVPAPGTGTFTYRLTGVDRSGNAAAVDQTLAFDTTAPTVGAPRYRGVEVATDQRFVGADDGYRPAITWSVADAHSGVAGASASIDEAAVPVTLDGSTATLAPASELPLGQHVLRLRVVDVVGNATVVERRVVLADATPPALDLAAPSGGGTGSAVLDVGAVDDRTGVDPDSWTVVVDGAPLVVHGTAVRLNAALGALVDGTHSVVVGVRDRAGNQASRTVEFEVDADPDVPQLRGTQLTGITVYDQPAVFETGSTYRIRAVFARAGRPVSGRAELHRGAATVAGKEIEGNGSVDLAVTVDVAGALTLHPPAGSGLTPVALSGRVPTAAAAAAPSAASAHVPLGETGSAEDRTAPTWRFALRASAKGVVRRTSQLSFVMWTNEEAVVNVYPVGAPRRFALSTRRHATNFTLLVPRGSTLGRRLRSARAGSIVQVPLRVEVVDLNGNRSARKRVLFRVLV